MRTVSIGIHNGVTGTIGILGAGAPVFVETPIYKEIAPLKTKVRNLSHVHPEALRRGELIRSITPTLYQLFRDWPEDFPHENGFYLNHCCLCGSRFYGHMRRQVCKRCPEVRSIRLAVLVTIAVALLVVLIYQP